PRTASCPCLLLRSLTSLRFRRLPGREGPRAGRIHAQTKARHHHEVVRWVQLPSSRSGGWVRWTPPASWRQRRPAAVPAHYPAPRLDGVAGRSPRGCDAMSKSEPERVMDDTSPANAERIHEVVDTVYRSESRRVLATLIRLLGDFALAEEALHDAFAAAAEQW